MSRSSHNRRRWGKLPKSVYKCMCTRLVRNKNKHMLRNLLSRNELDRVYNVSKNEVYDSWTWD